MQQPPPGFVDPEERTSAQELAANNIPVESPPEKLKIEWVGPKGWDRKPLGSVISVRSNNIAIGEVALEKLAREAGEEIDAVIFGAVNYQGRPALAIKVNPENGFPLKRGKSTITAGNAAAIKRLAEWEITKGRYRVESRLTGFIKTWVAVKEAGAGD